MVSTSEIVLAGAVGTAGLLLSVAMPPATVVRTIRPYMLPMSCVAVMALRLTGGSAWETLHQAMQHITHLIAGPGVLLHVLRWAWVSLQDAVAVLCLAALWTLCYKLAHYTRQEWQDMAVQSAFEWAQDNVPAVRKEMAKQKDRSLKDLEGLMGKDPHRTITRILPQQGRPVAELMAEMTLAGVTENKLWQRGKVSGAVYSHDDSHTQLMNAAYSSFSWSNPLHPGMWPSVNQYEAELISMTAHMLHNTGGIGTTTSGGTESIVLAIKAHRDHYGRRRTITHPELLCGPTAHAAVDKACELLGIRKVVVPCDPKEHTLIPRHMELHITSNTIMMYASAPNYPQGCIDPIEALSDIALKYNIGLHVDACLGGFVLPFAKKLGRPIPKFDFECPGVTSMSVDTHKYAYATKGTSVVLYRDEDLRHAQYFCYAKWTGGLYSTPTLAGSRPGALLACAWAAMVSIGERGYMERVESILNTSAKFAEEINKMEDLHVLGSQVPTMVVCFSSDTVDIYRVGDMMEKRGWSLNALQHPASIHICVTLNTVPNADKFVEDLKASVDDTRKEGAIGKTKGSAAIYGASGSMPAGPVNELLRCYTDMTLTP
jgi:sphinganine-1-phosphate aldolase